jgi:DNA-binding transcriptional LysR family regulator
MADRIQEQLACAAVFARVVEAGGFSAAARTLGMTKSAVSKQVARLESLVGTQLLRRTTRSVGLTEAGREYHARATAAIDLLKDGHAVLQGLNAQPSGLLRVTSPVTFGRRCLAPLLPEFLRMHPGLQLQLVLMDRPADLAEEDFDVALRIGRDMPEGAIARKLVDIDYVLCGAASAWPARRRPREPGALAELECLRYGEGEAASTWQFQGADGTRRIRVRGALLVNNSELLRDAVLGGPGIALLPDFVVADDLAAGRLVRLLPRWTPRPPFGSAAHLVWLPARHLPPKTRAFIDFVLERMASPRRARGP